MVIRHQIHGALPCVADSFVADTILLEGFLHQDVTGVLFVGENPSYCGMRPCCSAAGVWNVAFLQVLADHVEAVTVEVFLVDLPNDLCLLRNDLWITIRPFLIGVQIVVVDGGFTTLHGVALACLDIAGDGFALRLGKGSHHSQHQFCGLVHGIDVFFFKVDRDALCFQHSDVVEAVHRIAGKSGDRLGEDQVDLALLAPFHHPHEVCPLLDRCAGGTLIREDVGHRPRLVLHDLIGIVIFLRLVAVELILLFGGYPAVGRHPELPLLGRFCVLWRCGYHDHLRLVLSHVHWLLSMIWPFFSNRLACPFLT